MRAPEVTGEAGPARRVDHRTEPDRYRHWRLAVEGRVARLDLAVDPGAALAPGYALKRNSYDLGVDIELHDAVQRLRFEHPQVGAVVVASDLPGVFCASANIGMLARASHAEKVNFCKFTTETRNAIKEASGARASASSPPSTAPAPAAATNSPSPATASCSPTTAPRRRRRPKRRPEWRRACASAGRRRWRPRFSAAFRRGGIGFSSAPTPSATVAHSPSTAPAAAPPTRGSGRDGGEGVCPPGRLTPPPDGAAVSEWRGSARAGTFMGIGPCRHAIGDPDASFMSGCYAIWA